MTTPDRVIPETSLTYLGTLDDRVEAYPWANTKSKLLSAYYLRYTLMRHVLLGGPLILNDGYLIQNQLCLTALRSNADFGLRYLIDMGYVHVLTTGDDIVASLEARGENVATIGAVTRSAEWRSELRPKLAEINRLLRSRRLHIQRPRHDTSEAFLVTMMRLRNRTATDIGLPTHMSDELTWIFEEFDSVTDSDRRSGKRSGPRSLWEQMLTRLVADGRISSEVRRRFMNLANEAYHFSFATCIAADRPEAVGVETAISPALDEICDTAEVLAEDIVLLPRMELPAAISFTNPRKVHEILIPGHDLYQTKVQYLSDQALYLGGKVPRDHYESTLRLYGRRISEHFGKNIELGAAVETGLSVFVFGAQQALKRLGVPEEILNSADTVADIISRANQWLDSNGLPPVPETIVGGIGILGEKVALPMVTQRLWVKYLDWRILRSIEKPEWVRIARSARRTTPFISATIDKSKAEQDLKDVPIFR